MADTLRAIGLMTTFLAVMVAAMLAVQWWDATWRAAVEPTRACVTPPTQALLTRCSAVILVLPSAPASYRHSLHHNHLACDLFPCPRHRLGYQRLYKPVAMRRFPPPWKIEPLAGGGFKVLDSNGQTLAYVYGHADLRDAQVGKALTLDEARHIARNIAKLPELLGVVRPDDDAEENLSDKRHEAEDTAPRIGHRFRTMQESPTR